MGTIMGRLRGHEGIAIDQVPTGTELLPATPRAPWYRQAPGGIAVPRPRQGLARSLLTPAFCLVAAGLGTIPWIFMLLQIAIDRHGGPGVASSLIWVLVGSCFWLLYGLPLVVIANRVWRLTFPADGKFSVTSRIPIRKTWWEIARIGPRRGLRIHLEVEASGFIGMNLEVLARFKDPADRYLPARLRRYQGEFGEVRYRFKTAPIQNSHARFTDLWFFVPTRALPIPPGAERFECVAEVLLGIDGVVHTEQDLAISLVPTADDFVDLLAAGSSPPMPASAGPDGGIEIVATARTDGTESTCGVCGEGLYPPLGNCAVCQTPAHLDCWQFAGGCSVYGCEGRAPDPA